MFLWRGSRGRVDWLCKYHEEVRSRSVKNDCGLGGEAKDSRRMAEWIAGH